MSEPTLKDIAEAAKLSVAAVSKVLNNREGVSEINRRRVTEIARSLGYSGRSGQFSLPKPVTSAVLVTLDRYITSDVFYGDILEGIFAAAREGDVAIDLAIVTSSDPESSDYQALRESDRDCTILVGIDDEAVIEAVRAAGRPALLVNGMDRKMRISSISPDYNFGGWTATRHLLERGHREIVHVTHLYRESLRRRMLGFRDAIEEAGIAFSPDRHVIDVGSPAMMTVSCGEIVAERLSRDPRPTAVFCANDMVALGVLKAAARLGLSVPGDLSVIGFDGLSLGAHSAPPLTTMQIDRAELAREAFAMLLKQRDFATTHRLTLGVELVERQSVGPGPFA